MRQRAASALFLVSVGLIASGPAQAATVNADATVRFGTISAKGTPPEPGSSEIDAGTITGSKLGAGAIVARVTWGENLSFTARTTSFFRRGTVRGTLSGTAKLNPDGSATISGSGKFTGGTGRYKGAKGKNTFTGTLPSGGQVVTATVKGSFSYPE